MQHLSSLQIPWSEEPAVEEIAYRAEGLVRTVGTQFVMPPSRDDLIAAFEESHLGTALSVGAKALCKHYARLPDHPVRTRPYGNPQNKSRIAKEHLMTLLANATWRNVHLLPHQQLVYEMRDAQGYGMRWTLVPSGCKFRGYLEKDR